MDKKLPVITISREYAAYGRSVAAKLSERLGIPYYDRDFVKETAKVSGYSEEDIKKEGETMGRGAQFMNSLLNNVSSYASSYDGIYKAQKEVILELAKNPCIIVGRCADHILREAGVETFDIFLFADIAERARRAAELEKHQNLSEQELLKTVIKYDAMRRTYYRTYTKKEMGYYQNYNICLDTGIIDLDKCVNIICEILN